MEYHVIDKDGKLVKIHAIWGWAHRQANRIGGTVKNVPLPQYAKYYS